MKHKKYLIFIIAVWAFLVFPFAGMLFWRSDETTENTELAIWDYKIRPLVRGTNILPLKDGTINSHSLGFIQSSRIFYAYVRNNNNSQSQDEITDIIEKYLLPFNVTDIFVFMSNY